MKRFGKGMSVACFGLLASGVGLAAQERFVSDEEAHEWLVAEEIVKRIQAPVFPDRVYPVEKYGAVAGDAKDDSEAIREAIAACSDSGGGRVLVSEGVYDVGPVVLRSNVELHVAEGATLRFSTDPNDYLPAVFSRWEGMECYNYSPLIYAFGETNVAVTGGGVLDGRADDEHWWSWKGKEEHGWKEGMPHQKAARDRLTEQVARGVPVGDRRYGDGDYLRPSFVQPYSCENVLIEGVTIVNSPMWEIHPVLCRNVTVRGVSVISHGPNNDGCNPESCKDVLIEDCVFDTGDDCIAIKSGRNNDGRRVNVPSENIVVRNCLMKEGHGGVVIGSEISGGCRNVFVEDCEMSSPNLDRAIRIKTNSVRGGLIENVFVRNVRVGQVRDSVIKVNFHYEEGDVGDFAPVVRNIVVRNLVSAKSKYPLYIKGYVHTPISGLRLIDCQFEGAEKPSVLLNVKGLVFDDVRMNSGEKTDRWGNPL